MFSLGQDLRFALRQLRKSPGYAVVAILTLALGIGVNTAIFLLTWTIVLQSLPVPHPSELIRVGSFTNSDPDLPLSYPAFEAMREHVTAADLFAWAYSGAPLKENGKTQPVSLAEVTGNAFPALQLRPYLGRPLAPQAGERHQPFRAEALLSYNFWRSHFNGDPSIVGRAITLDNTSMTVVGVMPRGFNGTSPDVSFDILVPLDFQRITQPKSPMIDEPGAFWITAMGRLHPGQTLASLQASLNGAQQMILSEADPKHTVFGPTLFGGGFRFTVLPGRAGHSWLRDQYETPLVALEGLCGLMMLLCAVNTALLVLSRVSSRLHEFAVRSALGAPRGRLIAQVLIETALLAAGGMLLGGWIGLQLAHALVTLITPPGDFLQINLAVGSAIVLFAIALSAGAALLAGLWPAWRASRSAPALDLRQLHVQRGAAHLGRWIVPAQVALGVVLIYAAVLLTGTLRSYLTERSGFVTRGVTFAEMDYGASGSDEQEHFRKGIQLVDRLQTTPGVQATSLMSMPPIHGWMSAAEYFSHDSHGNVLTQSQVWQELVTPGYFGAVGTTVLEGRPFAQSDIGGDKVCVISRAAANYFFPGQDPVGLSIGWGDGVPSKEHPDQKPETYRILGVADDARMQSLLSPAPLVVYQLAQQEKKPSALAILAVRASSNAIAASAIRQGIAATLPGSDPKLYTFDETVNADLSRQRLLSSVSGGFALLALALVATGLYGILARTVVERRREIGIRMALGAQRHKIVSALARTAGLRIGAGVVVGAALAAMAGHLLHSLLYGVTAASPVVGIITLTLLVAVLTVAFVVPAGRAASVDPMEAIRDE